MNKKGFDLLEDFLDWNVMAGKWERGEKLEKAEVIELLNGGVEPTKRALPMLANMLSDTGQFINGKKKTKYEAYPILQLEPAYYCLRLERVYMWQEARKKKMGVYRKLRGAQTPREKAKETTIKKYPDLSIRKLEKYLREHEESPISIWLNKK